MKVLQFTVPVANEYSIVVQEDILPYFYNYLHRHKEVQITLIIKGEGTLIAGNYTQPCKPGDIYFIGSDQPHLFRSNASHFGESYRNNIHAIHIFFDHKHNLASLLELPELEPVKRFIEGTVFGLQVPSSHVLQVSGMVKEVRDSEGLDRLLNLIKLLQSCASHIKEWKSLSTGFSNHSFTDSEGLRMNDVYQYTIDHYSEDISLNKIASIACITPHAFCKYFKRHTRKTYLSFLHEIRVNEACKKIISGDFDCISSVAYTTGFNSIITFNRVFKKITSMAPKDYIKKYKFKSEEVPINKAIGSLFVSFYMLINNDLLSLMYLL
ncbi:AraC family transcriptional regulator [Pedobacter sp. FW305-3-2-15-E-R2A2]|uniref:AraC family transcriptional regulator n=1 Tax=Pedobacter sp. FW305-3-2-15-E-R2A2 TaxID=3140251 RepID=UPI00314068F0